MFPSGCACPSQPSPGHWEQLLGCISLAEPALAASLLSLNHQTWVSSHGWAVQLALKPSPAARVPPAPPLKTERVGWEGVLSDCTPLGPVFANHGASADEGKLRGAEGAASVPGSTIPVWSAYGSEAPSSTLATRGIRGLQASSPVWPHVLWSCQ